MGTFEYLLLFAAVILGLAVSDLAISLHRLLGAGRRVRWDGLAPLAALVAFLKIVTQWWVWHGAEKLAQGFTFELFVGILASTVCLFLMAAAALPDEVRPEDAVDLAGHWSAVQRRYWLLFLGHWFTSNLVGIWAQVQIAHAHFGALQPGYLVGVVVLALAFVRNRWVQGLALAAFAALYLVQLFGQPLPA